MNYTSVYMISRIMYQITRPILLKAIDDPDEEWDDFLMQLCDSVFGYTEKT